jgi:hypothetical protein
MCDDAASPVLEFQTHIATWGRQFKLCQKSSHTNFTFHYFNHRIINIWNSQPSVIVGAPSVSGFKNRSKKYWQTQDTDYNYMAFIAGATRNLDTSCVISKSFQFDVDMKAPRSAGINRVLMIVVVVVFFYMSNAICIHMPAYYDTNIY